ncbi:hypothetical protein MIND_01343100 [Mycena indigotica]|uniref:Uncharacterized protein n=1 Tax=Mycena indigotica TaxID=2126181 RepID=A0A8H6RXQ4_9AGAR|nr:uncharacterized protein MIND_01343100 [Mycena indigotica]KAF7289700.1 hypothetical protein MIND_01343100 [Mycena indigotica]
MLVALLAPELIFGFAARQLLVARFFRAKYNISLMHGFFVGMGGFTDANEHPVVTCEQLSDPAALAEIRGVSSYTIEDKSKGDLFSKGIALVQGIWFITQCIVRPRTGPSAVPARGRHPRVCKYQCADMASLVEQAARRPGTNPAPRGPRRAPHRAASPHGPPAPASTECSFFYLLSSSYDKQSFMPLSAHSVPSLWCAWDEDMPRELVRGAVGLEITCGSLFGVIHTAGWFVPFPSGAGDAPPLLVFLHPRILDWVLDSDDRDYPPLLVPAGDPGRGEAAVLSACFGVYCVARVLLLLLAFTTLRALPPAAFRDVNWSVYIPHL